MKATLLLHSNGDPKIISSTTLDPQPGLQAAAQVQKLNETT